MDLLAMTNQVADAQRRMKENLIRDCGCECEIPTMVYVFRDGKPHVGLRVEDTEIPTAFRLASKVFFAEDIAIAIDGTSVVRQREELATVTASRSGEIMWKLQPYAAVGRMLILPGAEVPDELPFADGPQVEDAMRSILAEPMWEVPWDQTVPEMQDANWATLDVETAKQVKDKTTKGVMPPGVTGVFLFADSTNERRRDILTSAGLPVIWL